MVALGNERRAKAPGARPIRDVRLRKRGQMVQVQEWLHDAIRALADETGVSISELVASPVEEWVRKNHPHLVPEDLRNKS